MIALAALGWTAAPLAVASGDAPGARPERAGWLDALDRRAGVAVSPRALARAHADLESLTQCTQCHAGLSTTPDERCLSCHEDVAARSADRLGWHGRLDGRCAGCHGEHRGADADLLGLDRDSWNHELAAFPLRGAHVEVDCDDCHRRAGQNGAVGFHAQGIPFARCADCHADVHGAGFLAGRDCGACHGELGFRADALVADRFDHARDAGFPLAGAHATAACGACHDGARRAEERAGERPPGSMAPRRCGGCHEDPHAGALGAGCDTCHGQASWRTDDAGARFDHARGGGFALDALHAQLTCASCHEGLAFAAQGRACADCHEAAVAFLAGRAGPARGAADPHAEARCRDCHAEGVAAPGLLDYERACLACHPAPYGSLLVTKKRIVDERIVALEAALRARSLARERGEALAGAERDSARAAELARIARTGLHNAALSEAALLSMLDELAAEGAGR